jgi:hypothetical protein
MIHSTYVTIQGKSVKVNLEVGPMPDNTYAYGYVDQDGWILSEHRYHNAQSAIHDARRPQQMNLKAHLEPAP